MFLYFFRLFGYGMELIMKNLVLNINYHKKNSCLCIFNIFKLISTTYENLVYDFQNILLSEQIFIDTSKKN